MSGLTIVLPASREPAALQPGYWRFIIDAVKELVPTLVVLEPRMRARLRWYSRSQGRQRVLLVPPLSLLGDVWTSSSATFICIEYGLSTFLTLVATLPRRGRSVFIFQEHHGDGGATLSLGRKAWRRTLVRLADGVVANTDAARGQAIAELRCKPDAVRLVRLLAPPPREEMLRLAVALEEPKRRPLFLFVGRLVALKNVGALLSATQSLVEDGLSLEVWIVGSGPQQAALLDERTVRRLDDVVRFCGRVDYRSLGHLYEACDVFVMPTLTDYRSVAVLEAMRFGRPVIDSIADGNAHDSVQHGENGLIFDPAKPDDLVACMRRFIVDPGLAERLGRRSAEVVEGLTPRAAARALLEALPILASAAGDN